MLHPDGSQSLSYAQMCIRDRNKLVWLKIERDENDLPVYDAVMDQYGKFMEDIQSGKIVSAYALDLSLIHI